MKHKVLPVISHIFYTWYFLGADPFIWKGRLKLSIKLGWGAPSETCEQGGGVKL